MVQSEVIPQAQVPPDHPSTLRMYLKAIGVAAVFFATISVYVSLRRGFYDLYIINKALAGSSALMLGLVLIIGPFTRFFNGFDHLQRHRKYLGIIAFFLAVAHVVSSYQFLPHYFAKSSFTRSGLWPFVYGVAALLALYFLFAISNHWARQLIEPQRWWKLQNWGVRLAFALVVLHVAVMKFPSWISWYYKGGSTELVHPEWPGAGVLVGWFLGFVIVLRLADFLGQRVGRAVWYFSMVALPALYIATFLWGRQFVR